MANGDSIPAFRSPLFEKFLTYQLILKSNGFGLR